MNPRNEQGERTNSAWKRQSEDEENRGEVQASERRKGGWERKGGERERELREAKTVEGGETAAGARAEASVEDSGRMGGMRKQRGWGAAGISSQYFLPLASEGERSSKFESVILASLFVGPPLACTPV